MKNAKVKVATGATAVLLGGLGGLALSQGGKEPVKPVADNPVVHTKVIRRTIHVTKHAKPKHPPAAAPVEPAPEPAPVVTAASGSSEPAPIATASSGGEAEFAPVTTATSGGGGGGEVEYESEGEGGDD